MSNDQINRAVAEKVMGWHFEKQGQADHWHDGKGFVSFHRTYFLDDLNCAFEAWREFMKTKTTEDILPQITFKYGDEGICCFITRKTLVGDSDFLESVFYEGKADTEAKALCLAMLEAVEES